MSFEHLPELDAWYEATAGKYADSELFELTSKVVLWTNALNDDGSPLVAAEPEDLVKEIELHGQALFMGHDPGRPVGRVLAAKTFVDGDRIIVAGVLGIYRKSGVQTFAGLGLDPAPNVPLPAHLPDLPHQSRVDLAVDPREVEPEWLEDVAAESVLPLKRIELSHNSAEAVTELIRVGLPYVLLVWNPFVTSFATEAGKASYEGVHKWLRRLWAKLETRKTPIVVLDGIQAGCQVSYLFRGKDPVRHNAAHDALARAAVQAAALINSVRNNALVPVSLVYEFDAGLWYPSNLTLADGRLIAEPAALIALERGEYSLSLGIQVKS